MMRKGLAGLGATCVLSLSLSAQPASAAATDVVLYASDAANLHGNWAFVSEAAAAGGQMLASADRGWSNLSNPLAAPADYFEFTFTAPADTPYHIWLRLNATDNSKYHDSVFVQFSDTVNASGAPLFPIGTTRGLMVNLATDASATSLSEWGWQDGAYWLRQPTIVRFGKPGSHTVRIQTREDGVRFDQLVLSPSTYLDTSPGLVTADHTIVPKPGSPSIPFTGVPATVPGTIQAADFDNGGEGIAYHDTTAGNEGGQYRMTDVDIENSSEGGYDVGWIAPTEWLKYTVSVASAGRYTAEFRVAASGQGGTFHLEANGSNLTGALTIPDTGDWQSWTTVTTTVTLAGGRQVLRLSFDTNGENSVGNVSWFRLTPVDSGPTPYGGVPLSLPGTVHTENFDNGGEGIAYHDTTPGNSGGACRRTDVDIQDAALGGCNIGWIADGEWLAYTVNVTTSGTYTLRARVASPLSNGRMHATFGAPRTGSTASTGIVGIPNTGDWQSWTTVSLTVDLPVGTQVMKLVFDTGGFNIADVTVSVSKGSGGEVINVPAGGDLQAALDSALPGSTILLAPGATYVGNFVLPVKSGTDYITLRSAAPDFSLPGPAARIDPTRYDLLSLLPKLRSPNSLPTLATAPRAHHYRLMFLELLANYQGYGDILTLGDGSSLQNTSDLVPHDLIVDRVYIHGDLTYGQKRGIALNSAWTTIRNSYIAEIKAVGQDSQAIMAWNGPGHYVITNNYLEAAGENVLFGGADPSIPSLVPSDVQFTQNHLSKPFRWRSQTWQVKNLLELKNAQDIVIDGNVMENNWAAAQTGYAVVFTPRNQDGTAPWSVVQRVRFTNNVVRHVSSGVNILGTDDERPSQTTNHLAINNNLFVDLSGARYGGDGRFMLIGGGADVTIDHNTAILDGSSALYAYGPPVQRFVFTNNIVPDYAYAVMGGDASPGNGTIARYFPLGTFLGGIYIGSDPRMYPTGNFYPPSVGAVGFVNVAGGNYRLSAASPYANGATDGTNPGCNIDLVNAAAGTPY